MKAVKITEQEDDIDTLLSDEELETMSPEDVDEDYEPQYESYEADDTVYPAE